MHVITRSVSSIYRWLEVDFEVNVKTNYRLEWSTSWQIDRMINVDRLSNVSIVDGWSALSLVEKYHQHDRPHRMEKWQTANVLSINAYCDFVIGYVMTYCWIIPTGNVPIFHFLDRLLIDFNNILTYH